MTEWDEIRTDFPALGGRAYLNAAAASPVPRPVRETVCRFYEEMETSGDLAWPEWLERRESIRASVARFVGAEAGEVAFVPNTSAGINLAVDLLEHDGAVLSDELEFPTVTLPWVHRGITVHFLPAPDGIVHAEAFAEDAAPEAAAIAVSHVQFSNGCRLDLDAFGRVKGARRLVVSGSQSVGAFRVDVTRSGIDVLACAGHKWLCAGYGAGFCVIRRELLASRAPRQVGWMSGADPYAFDNRRIRVLDTAARAEMGCPAFAGIFALGAAVDYLVAIGIERIEARVLALNEQLTTGLEDAGFSVLSPGGSRRSGETLVRVSDPQAACAFLASRGVLVTPKPQGLRVATHFYNDERDVAACLGALVRWRESSAG